MKKILLTLFTFVVCSLCATAQTAQKAKGVYKGDLYINLGEPVNDESEALPDQTIQLEANEDGETVKFAIYDFGFMGMNLGDIVLPKVGVREEGDTIKFEPNDVVDVELVMVGDEGNDTIFATANIDHETSWISGENIFVDVPVVWIMEGGETTPIYVRFVGKYDPVAGIDKAQSTEASTDKAAYSINGRRVNTTGELPRGLYIINGKKVIR